MANQLNRTVIACSALALAIFTLYYWQLRKRRKLSGVCGETDHSNPSQIEHLTNKIREDCLDSSNQESSLVDFRDEVDCSSLVSVIEKAGCSLEGSGNDLSTETNQSTISLDNHHNDIREDDIEGISATTSVQLSNPVQLPTELELEQSNITSEQFELSGHLELSLSDCTDKNLNITTTEVLEEGTEHSIHDNTSSIDSSFETMQLKSSETFSQTFSNSANGSSDNDELVCKFKQSLTLSEESSPNHLKVSSIDVEIDPKSPNLINSTIEVDLNSNETEATKINGADTSTKAEPSNESDAGNYESTLSQKADKPISESGLILNSNSDANADNSESIENNIADCVDSSASVDSDSRDTERPHLQTSSIVQPASAISSKNETRVFSSNTVKPNQTFAQVLSSSKNMSSVMQAKTNKLGQNKPLQSVSLDMSARGDNVPLGQIKEESDVYHNYPDATMTSSEGQCSPNSEFSDVRSQGSNDSGKGGSDILHGDSTNNGDQSSPSPYHIVNVSDDQIICFQFEMPHYLCGKLIGASGYFINSVKQKTNTQIVVNAHYFNPEYKICSITGIKFNVMNALNLIRRRFPLKDYPNVTLNQINIINPIPTIPLSQACQIFPLPTCRTTELHLPPDIITDVILSCTINAGHFFLQQPTHPSYTQLNQLDYCMKENYSQANAPQMPQVYPGIVCAAPTAEGWYRALIKNVHESNTECDIMFVDYGGYAYNVPVSTLRQIRYDFLTLPFQASECYLSNVVPIDAENGWSAEANSYFEELAQGQIIYASINGFGENDIPLVNLFKVQGSTRIFINQELVEKGHGVFVDSITETAS